MMPGFFQWLHPLLPFTYGINLLRETVGGMYSFIDHRNDDRDRNITMPTSRIESAAASRPAAPECLLDAGAGRAGYGRAQAL